MKFFMRSFRLPKHMSYAFKPRYYDERKTYLDELKEKYSKRKQEDKQEQIRVRLQSSFQRRFEEQRKGVSASGRAAAIRVFIIFIILSIFALYFIYKFMPLIHKLMK